MPAAASMEGKIRMNLVCQTTTCEGVKGTRRSAMETLASGLGLLGEGHIAGKELIAPEGGGAGQRGVIHKLRGHDT